MQHTLHITRTIRKDGYVQLVITFDNPYLFVPRQWTMLEHRFVVWRHTGRVLSRDQVVHHIDGNRANNRFANLRVMTRREHARLHARLRRLRIRNHRVQARDHYVPRKVVLPLPDQRAALKPLDRPRVHRPV